VAQGPITEPSRVSPLTFESQAPVVLRENVNKELSDDEDWSVATLPRASAWAAQPLGNIWNAR
jgi:hypothetical protein